MGQPHPIRQFGFFLETTIYLSHFRADLDSLRSGESEKAQVPRQP
jgi:hypothetical protein